MGAGRSVTSITHRQRIGRDSRLFGRLMTRPRVRVQPCPTEAARAGSRQQQGLVRKPGILPAQYASQSPGFRKAQAETEAATGRMGAERDPAPGREVIGFSGPGLCGYNTAPAAPSLRLAGAYCPCWRSRWTSLGFRCRVKQTSVLCLFQQMFNTVVTATSPPLIAVSLPTGSVYAYEEEK